MTPLLSLIFLVLIAYIGAVFFQKTIPTSLLLKGIINSGVIYLLIGYLIGPNFLKILDTSILENLSILLAFVLGWTGFLIGLQINVKQMRRFQIKYYWISLGNFFSIFVLISGIIFLINYFFDNYLNKWEIIIITTAASIGSPLLMGMIRREFKIRGKLIHFLQFHAAYDNMIGIIIIGFIIAATSANEPNSIEQKLLSLAISLLIVGGLAFLFYNMVKYLKNIPQYFLIIVGFILILVGMAQHFNQSTLFVSFMFGAILANLPLNTWKLFQTISNAEQPIYLLLLVFMGASLNEIGINVFLFAVGLSIIRLAMKYISGRLIFLKFDPNERFSRIIGLAGIGMGGLSVAMVIDYHLAGVSVEAEFILLIIGLSYLWNDALSLAIIKPVLKPNMK